MNASFAAEIVKEMSDAWNHGDAKPFAERFMEDGTFTNVYGTVSFGKQAFHDRHAEIFKGMAKGSSASMTVRRAQLVRPDVAIVDVDVELKSANKPPPFTPTDETGVVRTRLLLVLAKEGGRWLIAAFHNVPVVPQMQPR